MTPSGRVGRWLARLVAVGAIAAAAHGALSAVVEAEILYRESRRFAGDSIEQAQDRLFGRDYMESIRAVRRRVDVHDTVQFVDQKPPDGSSYFALFHLAPRRLVRRWRLENPLRHDPNRAGQDPLVQVRVPRLQAPLEIVEPPSRPASPKRARKARP